MIELQDKTAVKTCIFSIDENRSHIFSTELEQKVDSF